MTSAEVLAPLAALCARRGFTFSWTVRADPDGFRADVKAGWREIDGKLTGAHPWWVVTRPTEEAALTLAVDRAVSYWSR